MRRLLAALAALSVAFAAVVVTALPAAAALIPGPPSSTGFYGLCNWEAFSDTYTATSGDVVVDFACNYKLDGAWAGMTVQAASSTFQWGLPKAGHSDGYDGDGYMVVSSGIPSVGGPCYDSAVIKLCVTELTTTAFSGAVLFHAGWARGSAVDTTHLSTNRRPLMWPTAMTGTAANTTTYPYCLTGRQCWQSQAGGYHTAADTTAAPGRPADYFSGGSSGPVPASCVFTTDLPSNGTLTTGQTVHVTFTYGDGVVFPGSPSTTVTVLGVGLGETATPVNPNPPDAVWTAFTRTTSPQTVAVVAPHAGVYLVSARCDFADTSRITAGSAGPSTADFCAANPTVTGCTVLTTRPSLSDCLPSSSGGLFGIIGTVLDPQTYVTATACLARALFQPSATTAATLQSIWTTAQTKAPFSYIYDALAFLPGTFSAFSSGLSGGGGSCLVNIPGAGCATLTMTSDLGLVRSVLLFLFVGLLTLAMIRTTMRVTNGG